MAMQLFSTYGIKTSCQIGIFADMYPGRFILESWKSIPTSWYKVCRLEMEGANPHIV